jgi:hypothetical protein
VSNITVDQSEVLRGFRTLEQRQIPQATVWALNDTAADILKDIQDRMDVVFDRPTRFTKNAFMVWRATKQTLEAAVQERPSVGRRHYLKVQEAGGTRGQTGLERMLTSALPYAGVINAVTPASGAKLNQYGNWSVGQRNQAISAIKGFGQSGFNANATARSKKRNAGKRAAFFVPKPGSKLSAGIWSRDAGGGISKIVNFTESMPVYSKALNFQDGAERVFDQRIAPNMAAALQKALATSR